MEAQKPTLKQKIEDLIAKSGYKNLRRFHKAIVEMAGDDAITYSSLHNAINLTTKPHIKTLYQIATVLKLQVGDLLKGTTEETPVVDPVSGYIQLNEKSSLHNLFHGLPIKPQLLRVEGYGESIDEKIAFFDIKGYRFIFVIRGTVELILKHKDREIERKELRKGDNFCFDASILHHFKNNNAQYAEILITNFKLGLPFD